MARSRAASATLWLAALAAIATASACASKRVVPTTGPRFPAFLFPTVPSGLDTPDLVARHQRAWTLLQSGDFRRSTQEFTTVLERAPGFYPSETGLGYVALGRREEEDAVSRFDRVLEQSRAYTPALVGRGQALLALGRDDEALGSFEAALGADPSLADVERRVEVLRFRRAQESVAAAERAAVAGRFDEARAAYSRAIAASPQSGYLYRELGMVELKAGKPDDARSHLEKAVELESGDAASHIALGQFLEERSEFDGAIASYTVAQSLDPSSGLEERIARLKTRTDLARLPAEYGRVGTKPDLTRADLAALLGVRLKDLVESMQGREAMVITDARGNWAAPWIFTVTRAGIIEIFPNHTFQPDLLVKRGDLALVVSRVLTLVGARRPALALEWEQARPRIADVGPEHLSYPAVAMAVAAGVLPLLDGDTFDLGRPVNGAEAGGAVDRLRLLASADASGRD